MDKEKEVSDTEDIPSDFFDDFNKEEFMDGLSVIDSWDEEGIKRGHRIDAETVDSVKDLRELIRDGKEDDKSNSSAKPYMKFDDRYKWTRSQRESPHERLSNHRRSSSGSRLDEYIKPGSRRDPNKTNEAIKRDKEVKVKEHLAKKLESSENLRPPGTELDDFFDHTKSKEKKKPTVSVQDPPEFSQHRFRNRSRSADKHQRVSSARHHWKYGQHYNPRWSPRRSPRQSPHRYFWKSPRYSPRRYSPQKNYRRYSPLQRSPRRRSPQRRSPRRIHRSRSPMERSYKSRRSHSKSSDHRDSFLYPVDSQQKSSYPSTNSPYPLKPGQNYTLPSQYPGVEYSYPQAPAYTGAYSGHYEYQSGAPVASVSAVSYVAPASAPQPVPAPVLTGTAPAAAPAMVPPLVQMTSPSTSTMQQTADTTTPYDALAKLAAEGKISQQDYLKLAPCKNISSPMDNKTRVVVLNRCHQALAKLGKLLLPNRLIMNNNIVGQEPKCLAPKYCSPLKRQVTVEFHFTKATGSATAQQNKQLIDGIIAAVGLEKVIARPKKKVIKNMKDASVQTNKPYCDVCEIRDSTKLYDVSTSIDPEYFSCTVHTQVVEQDLVSSKAVFNPSGSIADGAPISIAHLTPAQLVSQLAARAKTLKQNSNPAQSSSSQFERWNPPNSYDYDGRGGGGGQYYNNYRY